MNDFESSVYEEFRTENWEKSTYDERMASLQKLEVISATNNSSKAQLVTAEYMEGSIYGYFDGDGIVVNRYVVEQGKFVVHDEDGKVVSEETVSAANIQMMNTIYHEDFHSFQQQAVDGEISQDKLDAMGITPEILHEWEAGFQIETKNLDNLQVQEPDNELRDQADYSLYRISSLEKYAHDAGDNRTQEAFAYLNEKYGTDPNYPEYAADIANSSYEKQLEDAKRLFNDADIEQKLQAAINEKYDEQMNSVNVDLSEPENAHNEQPDTPSDVQSAQTSTEDNSEQGTDHDRDDDYTGGNDADGMDLD